VASPLDGLMGSAAKPLNFNSEFFAAQLLLSSISASISIRDPCTQAIYFFPLLLYTVCIFHKETRKPFLSAGAGKKGFVVSKGNGAAFGNGCGSFW
jgi:hypothetical protein